MSVNSYYQDELNYLKELGGAFAKANPRLSKYLDDDPSDPDVERLMEGFAFLVGRLRQRLDSEMPEVAHSLLKLIWPHYLRPVPPITTIKFRHAPDVSDLSIHVPKGTTVKTAPIDGEAVPFRTSYDLHVLPLEVQDVAFETRKESAQLTVSITKSAGAGLAALSAAPLSLYLGGQGDPTTGRQLFFYLMERLRSVRLHVKGQDPIVADVQLEPMGFDRREATLPYPEGSFDGFRIMQEYFACPEKFMYIRIRGLEKYARLNADGFKLEFNFNRGFANLSRVLPHQIQLNTTPAVNLFEAEGQALLVSHNRSEYPVRPVGGTDLRSVHEVLSVTGWVQGSNRRINYQPFESFAHDTSGGDQEGKLYYRSTIKPSVLGEGIDHYVSFVTRLNQAGLPETETISLNLLCSNGVHAGKFGIGSVSQPTSETPAKLVFTNITRILGEVPPPLDDKVLWTLIANLSRNYASLIDVEALRTVIGAYDFRANVDRQAGLQRDLLLQSFKSFERKGVDIFRNGRPVRAYELVLRLAESAMGGEAEMYLFGCVLDRFLKSYASINSLHRLSIVGTDANTLLSWLPKEGSAEQL
ncbi:type VI secretion system baseplate subunit TssF [Roseibium denhamense]|uniref:Type VI secretion system protein ImpG n=1 Tax=Roseibium denhamense TaxID=76305 RepID=A0ABY1NWG6_9HYPH|nr:type VI secretion system baseplate subunit TssF [Roseibium denhamense]MTI04867.1 type VI secretion system baseplate subunit TssF [Roseibium denhamense]SMP20096.1 type VI secretion system protein ImpG [Roseibium denhamense]